MFFSHTAGGLGLGHVTERRAVAFVVSAITDLPTHPPQDFNLVRCLRLMCNFVILLVSHLFMGMLCVHFYEFGIKFRLWRWARYGYQWCVRNSLITNYYNLGWRIPKFPALDQQRHVTSHHSSITRASSCFLHLKKFSLNFSSLPFHPRQSRSS